MIHRVNVLIVTLALCGVFRLAQASDSLLDLAEKSVFPDSPHRLSAEHNIANALTKVSVLDPSKSGPGAEAEKAEFARTMSQLAVGYMQLGADALAASALQRAASLSKKYLYEYAEALYLAGSREESLKAFDEALDSEPDDTDGVLTAAFYQLMEGDSKAAIPLLRRLALGSATANQRASAIVYLVLAAQMQKSEPRRIISDIPGQDNTANWPLDLRDVLISGSTRSIANTLPIDKPSFQDRLCEALFDMGFSREIDGKDEQAQRFYRAALDTRAMGIRAYVAARIRLTELLSGARKQKVLVPRNLS